MLIQRTHTHRNRGRIEISRSPNEERMLEECVKKVWKMNAWRMLEEWMLAVWLNECSKNVWMNAWRMNDWRMVQYMRDQWMLK